MKTVRNLLMAILFTTALASANPAQVQSVTLDKTSIQAGQTATATVHLNTAAPAGGLKVEVWADDSATVPSYVIVPAGQTAVSFQVRTSADSGNATVRVAALQPQASASSNLNLYTSRGALSSK